MEYKKIIGLLFFIILGGSLSAMETPISLVNPDRRLLEAAQEGNVQKAQEAIEDGASVNAMDEDGRQAIHLAAAGGHLPIIELLIANDVYVNAADTFGYLPIHRAAENGHVKVVEWLVEHGADVSAIGGLFSESPVQLGTGDTVALLVDYGSKFDLNNPAIQDKLKAAFTDPILQALINKQSAQVIQLLADYLGNPEKDSNWINRVFLLAAARGDSQVVEFMLRNFSPFIIEESLQRGLLMATFGDSLPTVRIVFRLALKSEGEEGISELWRNTINRALMLSAYRRNLPILDYILGRDFALSLHLDLNAVGNYITKLLRGTQLQKIERDEYTRLRESLVHAIRTNRVATSMAKALAEEEPTTQLGALIKVLPIELMLLILSFLPRPSAHK